MKYKINDRVPFIINTYKVINGGRGAVTYYFNVSPT
jgi:hypothetical protein